MANKKKDYLEHRVPDNYSIKRKVKIAFRQKCEDLQINHNDTVEELMLNFLQQ